MKAFILARYGGADRVRVGDLPDPDPREDEVLVQIHAAGVNLLGSRVMFGSDEMNWPGAIEYGIEGIESAAFLTSAQKRDILYNNAARFLRFSPEEIARHHRE